MVHQFISKLSDKERKIFYIAVPFVLLALYDRLLLGPAVNSLAVLDEKIVQQEKIVKSDLRYLEHKDQMQKEIDLYSPYLVTGKVESKDLNRGFLGTVEGLAVKAEVNIVKSNPTESRIEEGFSKYYADVDCIGTIEQLLTFMHAINTSNEMLKVDRFKLSPKRGTDGQFNASLSIAKLVVASQ